MLSGVILLLAIAGYVNSVGGRFVWDDRMLILKDPAVRSFRQVAGVFSSDFFQRSESPVPYGYYRPLTTLSYMFDRALWGLKPFGFHLTNIALHGLASVLAFFFLLRLGLSRGQAGAAAALFAVDPLHSENVAWIAGRTDLLAFVFGVGAILLHLAAQPPLVETGNSSKTGKRHVSETGKGRASVRLGRESLALALFGLSLLAKEMAVVIPAWIFLVHLLRRREGWRGSLKAVTPFVAVFAGYAVIRFAVVDVPPPRHVPGTGIIAALMTAPATVLRYLGWLVSPKSPSAYVQNPYVRVVGDPRFWGAALVLAAVTYGIVRASRKDGRIGLLAAMFGLSLIPILNFVRVASPADMGDTMAARFCYMPSLPFLALAVVLVARRRWLRPALGAVVTAGLVTLGLAGTWRRNSDWRDEQTLFAKTVAQAPDAPLPWVRLGFAELRRGKTVAAGQAFARASSLAPDAWIVLNARVNLLVTKGRAWEALPLQEKLVGMAGRARPVQLSNLAFLERVTGHVHEARTILERLIAEGHATPDVWFNLAEVYRAEEKNDAASAAYAKAIAGDPFDVRKLVRVASFAQKRGDLAEAQRLYRRVVQRQPGNVQARLGLADLLAREGQRAGARAQLLALVRDTDDPRVRRAAQTRLDMLGGASINGSSDLATTRSRTKEGR